MLKLLCFSSSAWAFTASAESSGISTASSSGRASAAPAKSSSDGVPATSANRFNAFYFFNQRIWNGLIRAWNRRKRLGIIYRSTGICNRLHLLLQPRQQHRLNRQIRLAATVPATLPNHRLAPYCRNRRRNMGCRFQYWRLASLRYQSDDDLLPNGALSTAEDTLLLR